MVIILPNSKNGLNRMVREMKKKVVHSYQWIMDKMVVEVVLPKFEYAQYTELNNVLKHVSL